MEGGGSGCRAAAIAPARMTTVSRHYFGVSASEHHHDLRVDIIEVRASVPSRTSPRSRRIASREPLICSYAGGPGAGCFIRTVVAASLNLDRVASRRRSNAAVAMLVHAGTPSKCLIICRQGVCCLVVLHEAHALGFDPLLVLPTLLLLCSCVLTSFWLGLHTEH